MGRTPQAAEAKEPEVHKLERHRSLPVLAATLLALSLGASFLVGAGHAASAGAPSGPARARITGMPILGTAGSDAITAEAAPAALPSKRKQIQVLAAVLKYMRQNYREYAGYTPGPQDILDYGIGPLWLQGIDGAGTTIAVIEGWDLPDIAKVVAGFDKPFGLPNPHIQTIFPSGDGKLPAKCPPGMVKLGSYGSCSAWQGELELDVITAHLIAPYANILISATPADSQVNDDAASQVAPPEMMEALEQIAGHHLANVISISDGTGESTYSYGKAEITAQDPGELAAAAAGIPVLVASGDCGVVQNLAVANGQCQDTSATPDTAAWDDSPWVTAVGGSVPNLSPTGTRLGPDYLWHVDGSFSEGAGYSSVFARPAYENGVAAITGSPMRSVPDLTMDAQDGTSEAAPMLAGALALATQLNQANVGPINPVLYDILGPLGSQAGIADVVGGDDSAETPQGQVSVPGFTATKGFDVASGWGTIYAPRFVPMLVAATRAAGQEHLVRREALTQLTALEHDVSLSSTDIRSGGLSYLLAQGFLPYHPVQLLIGNRTVATLTADTLGAVTYMIDPSMLKLVAGRHRVELQSMLINVTAEFTSH
jgi:subtilase family serine protease